LCANKQRISDGGGRAIFVGCFDFYQYADVSKGCEGNFVAGIGARRKNNDVGGI
jgi:hypothetical protein